MRGTKRLAMSDSTPSFSSNETSMQSKRVTMGSPFNGQGVEPSIQPPRQPSPLNMQMAESSRQHVKALNTQFASWVQAQLLSHPDELWEDGAQDYLNHAESIMEQFSDVVNWLKVNAEKGERSSELHSNDPPVKSTSEIGKNNHQPYLDKPGFPLAASPSFGTSWRAGGSLFSNNAPLTIGGSQVSVPGSENSVFSNPGASIDADKGYIRDAEDDVEQPSSPSVKKSEEKGIIVVHEVKCKLYVKSIDPIDKDSWKDKGMGQLTIKCKEGISKGTKESKPNIIVRNDVGKAVLNALLYPGMKTNKLKNSIVAVFHTSADGDSDAVVARTFLIKTKTEDDRDKLAAAIQDYAPVP